jgi:hypothetical protein
MTKITLCLYTLLLPLYLFSQRVEVSESLDLGRESVKVIGQIDTTLYLLRTGFAEYSIQGLGNSLQESWKKEIRFDFEPIEIISYSVYNSEINIIYGYFQKGNTIIRLKKLDEKGFEKSDTLINTFRQPLFFNHIAVDYSDNKRFALVYLPNQRKGINLSVIDLFKNQLQWSLEEELKQIDYFKHFCQAIVNNDGEVFINLEFNNSKSKRLNHYFEIHHFKDQENKFNYKIPFSGLLSLNQVFAYDEINKQIIVAGFYSQNVFSAKGLFYGFHNLRDSINLITNAFDESFIRSFTGDKRKKVEGISNLDIKDLILRRDGGAILIAEQVINYDYGMTPSFYNDLPIARNSDFLYENILLASVNPDGSLHWKDVLFKNQKSENDYGKYSSFFIMKSTGNLRFLYNDDINWSTNIFEYVINPMGSNKRNQIFQPIDSELSSLLPDFKKATQTSASTLVALHQRNQKFRLLRFQY